MLLLDGQVHHDTHVIPMGNYVIGVGNYVSVSPSELGNYVSADNQETDSRTIALDYAGMVLPQISRFFAAVTAVTMGPGKEIADAARQLGTTGGALLEAAGARKRNHARAQDRFDRELGKLRAAADRRRQ